MAIRDTLLACPGSGPYITFKRSDLERICKQAVVAVEEKIHADLG